MRLPFHNSQDQEEGVMGEQQERLQVQHVAHRLPLEVLVIPLLGILRRQQEEILQRLVKAQVLRRLERLR
jgi:hypothetical protein